MGHIIKKKKIFFPKRKSFRRDAEVQKDKIQKNKITLIEEEIEFTGTKYQR